METDKDQKQERADVQGDAEDLFRVGCITRTHGVRGEVKVYPTGDEPQRFKKYKSVMVDDGKTRRTFQIESVKFFKQMVIVKFRECQTMEDAEKLRGADILVTRAQAVPLGKDEYYISDLIGLKVFSDDGKELGELDDVMQTGANDVYVVQHPNGTEILIPAIKDCIRQVDIPAGRMTVHLLEGLA